MNATDCADVKNTEPHGASQALILEYKLAQRRPTRVSNILDLKVLPPGLVVGYCCVIGSSRLYFSVMRRFDLFKVSSGPGRTPARWSASTSTGW